MRWWVAVDKYLNTEAALLRRWLYDGAYAHLGG